MKIVSFIPYWIDYEVASANKQHKNLKKLGGSYLINYTLSVLNSTSSIQSSYIFASNRKIVEYVEDDKEFLFLERSEFLDSNEVSIEDIIDEFLESSDADIIVMMHPNAPFLRPSTVNECVEKVVSKKYDSAFTAYEYKKLAWFKEKPLNYSLDKVTPHLSQLEPVVLEQSALYVFSRSSYLENRSRVGSRPYVKAINHFEGHEINALEDYEMAELIVNSGMYSEF